MLNTGVDWSDLYLVSHVGAVVVGQAGGGSRGAAPGVDVGVAAAPAERGALVAAGAHAPTSHGSLVSWNSVVRRRHSNDVAAFGI